MAALTVRADVTAHEVNEIELNPSVPAAVADALRQQMGGSLQHQISIQVKNGKCRAPAGVLESITDAGKGTITLLDSRTRQFATLPLAEYREKIAAKTVTPAQAKLLQSANLDISPAQRTGEPAEIESFPADEYLIVMTLQAGAATTRLEMRIWATSKQQADRPGALQELAACSGGPGEPDASQSLQKLTALFPGLTDKLDRVMASIKDLAGGLTLKTQLAIFSPAGSLAPAMTAGMEFQGFSTDSLPETTFAVPADYQEASADTLLAAMQPPPVHAPAGLGAGVTAPSPIYSPAPKYTDEARLAKIEGSVTLLIQVDENGAAQIVRVLQPLDPGLDQRAVDTVSQWKFKPAEKDGHPVAAQATVRVTFRLPAEERQ